MELINWVYVVLFFFGIYFLFLFILLHLKYKKELYGYPKPKRFPKISFLTAAYNEEDSIEGTVRALLSIEYPEGKKEIIVVNDGSKDRTASIVRKLMKNHKEIRLIDKKNSGKANSLNQAIKIAKGELIAVVDADSYPGKDSLYKMVGYFEDKKVAAVTSRVLVKNTSNIIEKFQAVDYAVIAWSRKILDFIGCVYVTNGPLSIYRKEVVVRLGGFDSKNLTEDIELTWHILSFGYKTKMSYATEVYTTVPSKFKKWVLQRVRWNLGGLQTLYKYRRYFLRSRNLFGYFVINYVGLAFILALVGFFLLLRFLFLKLIFYLSLTPFLFKGYNPFSYMEFYYPLTLILAFGLTFLILSVIYHKYALKKSTLKRKGIFTILTYIFIYRPFYIIPLLLALYKLAKGDLGWYTK